MAVSYKKLWKQLIDRGWKRKDLEAHAQVSHNVMSRLGKGQYVTMDSMEKICDALKCDIGDVMEFVPNDPSAE